MVGLVFLGLVHGWPRPVPHRSKTVFVLPPGEHICCAEILSYLLGVFATVMANICNAVLDMT